MREFMRRRDEPIDYSARQFPLLNVRKMQVLEVPVIEEQRPFRVECNRTRVLVEEYVQALTRQMQGVRNEQQNSLE